jgi:organic hydroperoxide reductase OsmC/OhrA
MKGEPVRYNYTTQLEWTGEKKGILKCEGKPDIMVACPPEFGGHPNIWSPEDVFLASVEICTMTTLLWFTNKENIILKSYSSVASGTVELIGGVFQFRSITVKIQVCVSSEDDRIRVERLLKKVERACLITNSINTDVNIESEIVIE